MEQPWLFLYFLFSFFLSSVSFFFLSFFPFPSFFLLLYLFFFSPYFFPSFLSISRSRGGTLILEDVNSQQLTVRFSMVVSSIHNFYLLIFDELFCFIFFFGNFGRKVCLDSCRAQLLSEYQTGGKEIDACL